MTTHRVKHEPKDVGTDCESNIGTLRNDAAREIRTKTYDRSQE